MNNHGISQALDQLILFYRYNSTSNTRIRQRPLQSFTLIFGTSDTRVKRRTLQLKTPQANSDLWGFQYIHDDINQPKMFSTMPLSA